jgi:hypothetical protein
MSSVEAKRAILRIADPSFGRLVRKPIPHEVGMKRLTFR